MKKPLHALRGMFQRISVIDVGDLDCKARIVLMLDKIFWPPGNHVVNDYDIMAVGNKAINQMASDEARTSGNETFTACQVSVSSSNY